MNGILPLWKPKGYTSHDCVSKVRGMLKTKKVGHTGTLDPEVEGVLPLCVGKATKIVPYLTDTEKVYEAVVTLGYATDTEDATGTTVETKHVKEAIQPKKIEENVERFEGVSIQTPPMYSAVKVNGRKLYEYAREGIEVERPTREIHIQSIELTSIDDETINGTFSFSMRVVCSKGTYIRTLCVDIGRNLGFPAHMSYLVRTRTADISKEECYTLEEVQKASDEGRGETFLLPLSRGLSHLTRWEIDASTSQMIKHGRVLPRPSHITTDMFTMVHNEEVLAIYQTHPEKPDFVKPVRVF